jgi:hypothetical protein
MLHSKLFALSGLMAALLLTAGGTAAAQAKLTDFVGKVEIKPPNGNWTPARKGMTIAAKSMVSTGFKSKVTLELDQSTLFVNQLTRLSIEEIARTQGVITTNINIRAGSLAADIKTGGTDYKHDFKVKSPVSTAAVRGTRIVYDGYEPADDRVQGRSRPHRDGPQSRVEPAAPRLPLPDQARAQARPRLRHGELVELHQRQHHRRVLYDLVRRETATPGFTGNQPCIVKAALVDSQNRFWIFDLSAFQRGLTMDKRLLAPKSIIRLITATVCFFFLVQCELILGNGDSANVGIDLSQFYGGSGRAVSNVPVDIHISEIHISVFGPGMEPIEKIVSAGARFVNMYVPAGEDRCFTLEVFFTYDVTFTHPHLRSYKGRSIADLRPGRTVGLKFQMVAGASQLLAPDYLGNTVFFSENLGSFNSKSAVGFGYPSTLIPTDMDLAADGRIFITRNAANPG